MLTYSLQEFTGDPDDAGRARFALYAPHIRWAFVPPWEAGPRIVRELKYLKAHGPLLPKVRKLTIFDAPSTNLVLYFAQPKLRELRSETLEGFMKLDGRDLLALQRSIVSQVPQLNKICFLDIS